MALLSVFTNLIWTMTEILPKKKKKKKNELGVVFTRSAMTYRLSRQYPTS